MSKTIYTRCTWALLIALLAFCTMSANAQLGSGWVSYSPTKRIHLDDEAGLQTFTWTSYKSVCSPICADYRSESGTETFRILDSRSNRSEIRLQNEYSSGSRQFEGYVTIYSPLEDESLFQIFGSTSGATQLMIRGFAANNGTISGGGASISNIYGKEVRVNVIHLQENVGNKILIYFNGVKKGEIADNEAVTNYQKYGCYGTTNGNVPAVVKWRNVRVFQNGTPPSTSTGSVTLYQNCSYGGYSGTFGVGSYTMTDLAARGVSNDDVSSIRVPSGLSVTLYADNNFSGSSTTLTSDNSCLTGIGWNDRVSSIRVVSTSSLMTAEPEVIEETAALSASPNPVNSGKANLHYVVHEDSNVKISILNTNGQEVKTLVNEFKRAGQYTATWETGSTPKGLYFAKMLQGRKGKTIKLLVTE